MSCCECPYNPFIQIIRNGGEEICPDAFTDVSQNCGFNQENKEKSDNDRSLGALRDMRETEVKVIGE